ncbi:hypothetical protein BH09PAT4_BH09PAT4_05110 [soil metagenome]
MANSLLLFEGTGIGYERRQQIVDDADSSCFGPIEAGQIARSYSPESFHLLTSDFVQRLLPEVFTDDDLLVLPQVHSEDFGRELSLDDRFDFLKTVAGHIKLFPDEVAPCAEILGVRPALLAPATTRKEKLFEFIGFTAKETVRIPIDEPTACDILLSRELAKAERGFMPPPNEIAV